MREIGKIYALPKSEKSVEKMLHQLIERGYNQIPYNGSAYQKIVFKRGEKGHAIIYDFTKKIEVFDSPTLEKFFSEFRR